MRSVCVYWLNFNSTKVWLDFSLTVFKFWFGFQLWTEYVHHSLTRALWDSLSFSGFLRIYFYFTNLYSVRAPMKVRAPMNLRKIGRWKAMVKWKWMLFEILKVMKIRNKIIEWNVSYKIRFSWTTFLMHMRWNKNACEFIWITIRMHGIKYNFIFK